MADLPGIQSRQLPPPTVKDLSGKTVVVIGANTGIGLESCYQFARMNAARIILGCRSLEKGQEAVKKIESETGYTKAEVWTIDLLDQASVKAFADKYKQDGGRLDILLMNAGIARIHYEASPHGHEALFQVNHISTSYLVFLLTPILIKTSKEHGGPTRVSVVSSGTHYWVEFPKDLVDAPNIVEMVASKEFSSRPEVMQGRYPISKQFNVQFARAYANHFSSESPIIITSADPGLCKTELSRDVQGEAKSRIQERLDKWGFTAEQGSRMIVRSVVWENGPGEGDGQLNGGYCAEEAVQEPSDFVISEEGMAVQEKLWNDTIDLLSRYDPEVKKIVGKHFR